MNANREPRSFEVLAGFVGSKVREASRHGAAALVIASVVLGSGCQSRSAAPEAVSKVTGALGFDNLRRVSVSSTGAEAEHPSYIGAAHGSQVSADGTRVVFLSAGTMLVPGPQNGTEQVYVKRMDTGEVIRASQGIDGLPANGSNFSPVITDDARYVAFQSTASNLVAEPSSNHPEIFLHDTTTRTTERVSVGIPAGFRYASNPAVSADGGVVAFAAAVGPNSVFVRDRARGVTEAISASDVDVMLGPWISADGRYVSFVAGTSGSQSLILFDRTLHSTTTVLQGTFYDVSMSRDAGQFAFEGSDGTLSDDSNGYHDIFLFNRTAHTTVLLSGGSDGSQADGDSTAPRISGDGRFVTFDSSAHNLPGAHGGLYLYDPAQRAPELIADDGAHLSSLNRDGRYVAFSSTLSDVVTGDTNGVEDVFLGDRGASIATGTIAGVVRDLSGHGIAGVTVTAGVYSATTDANGAYRLANVSGGTYVVQASKSGWTFGSADYVATHRSVTIPPADIVQPIVGFRELPVVFVRGWEESDLEFGDMDTALNANGYYTGYAQVHSGLFHTPSFEENADRLKEKVDEVLALTGQPKVNLLAHSMGGLVARAYVEGPSDPGTVDKLFSFGSPHLGVPQFSLGLAALAECTLSLGTSAGVCEMTSPGIDLFNLTHPPRAAVSYHAIAGDPPIVETRRVCKRFSFFGRHVKVCISFPWFSRSRSTLGIVTGLLLRTTDDLSRMGGEDGFISRPSALGVDPMSSEIDRYTTREVHDLSLGPRDYFQDDDHDLSGESYHHCIEPVLGHRSNTCGERTFLSFAVPGWVPSPLQLLAAPASRLAASAATDELASPIPGDLSGVEDATLAAGQTLTRKIAVEGGRTVFAARSSSGTVALSLIDPTGKTIDPQLIADQDADVDSAEAASTDIPNEFAVYSTDAHGAMYDFPNALPGQWTIVLKAGADVPAGGTTVESFAAYSSTLHASTTTDRKFYGPGHVARVAMTFSLPPDSATVRGEVLRADGVTDTVTLTAEGAGVYAASYRMPAASGYVRLAVKATGTFHGAPFERGGLVMAQITSSAIALSGRYTDHAEAVPGSPTRKQALIVGVAVNSTFSGQAGVAADLVDSVGNVVAHAVTAQTVSSGATTVTLRFPADQIFAAHASGPLTLTHLVLLDERGTPIVAAQVDNAYQTAAYDYRNFAPALDVPVLSPVGPFAVREGSTITLDASAVDPEGDTLTYAWDLDGNGSFETSGRTPVFAAGTIDGPAMRNVRVRVTDPSGHAAEAASTIDITNVAPSFSLGDEAHLATGDTLQRTRMFDDPGPDTWTATVDYGDGSAPGPLPVSGRSFTLNHQYASAGAFVVTVTVADDDETSGSATLLVDVTGASAACRTVAGATSPTFIYVQPDLTTANCGTIDLGTADACGSGALTVTNNAPAKFRPGTTTVTWTVRDGAGHTSTASQRVTLLLGDDPACCPTGTTVVLGTSSNDTLHGSAGSDCILGRGGQDTINGLGGDDFISGGDGDDVISAGIGNDVVFGGSGQDRVTGDDGNDQLYGGNGDDVVHGSAGDDTLNGGQGQDQLFGDSGNDVLVGNDGTDSLNGGDGNDNLVGSEGSDVCTDTSGASTFASCETAPSNSCTDRLSDGTESDVDCGGGCDTRCIQGKSCRTGNDCSSFLCMTGRCAVSSGIGTSSSGLLQAALQITSDWGSGYCAALSVINNAPSAALSWTVGIDLNGATTYTSFNGTFSGVSGAVTVSPAWPSNRTIAAFSTDESIGFCANRAAPGSGAMPSVTRVSGPFF